jgi:hypothetical protein
MDKYNFYLNIDNTGHFYISIEDKPETKIVRESTENNLNYWFAKCQNYFIYEDNKFENRISVPLEMIREYFK